MRLSPQLIEDDEDNNGVWDQVCDACHQDPDLNRHHFDGVLRAVRTAVEVAQDKARSLNDSLKRSGAG